MSQSIHEIHEVSSLSPTDEQTAEKTISIAEYLLTRLAEAGVRHMFGVPGDFNLWFLEKTVQDERIEFTGCCNELNASYAADGCARLAGISALAITYGAGELASLSGLAGAYAERVPIVCINGAPPLYAVKERARLHHSLADGNFDNMMACYREFTVAHTRVEPLRAREEIDRVLRACVLEKRPVYLQLPCDVAAVRVPAITAPLDLDPPASDPGQLEHAVKRITERLLQAHSPALLVDVDADRFGLTEVLVKLAEACVIPMAYLIPAKGVLDDTHPLVLGMYRGAASAEKVKEAIEGSDCLICIGARFTDVSSGYFSQSLREELLIDVRPYSVKLDGETLSGVQSKELLVGLLLASPSGIASLSEPSHTPPQQTPFQVGKPLTQTSFWQHMGGYLRPGDVVSADIGTCFFGSVGLQFPENVTFVAQPIWASIGYSLPALLGSCLAAPERRQILFIGDGAFQVTAQELSSLLRRNLKPIIFLINNDGYTMEQLIYGADSIYNDIQPWRYSQLPAVFGAASASTSHVVATEDELERALHAAQYADTLTFIEVVLPRMDAPEPLLRFSKKAAAFDLPKVYQEID
ncbi:thiamine pyrophosphate-binding protein [Granulicella sp. dw_53]|uniref:alpha-keto acid decarboxylase family protein n=1 Tax=Granulicella sp. dw_53 TaxID=2719792 RepID=UPI001BD2E691|nr:thiamine pyrophosphate-binding protein [Granulicella sp. dw_53]